MSRSFGFSSLALVLLFGYAFAHPARPLYDPSGAATGQPPPPTPAVIQTASGLKYVDINVGNGRVAKAGDTVETHYTGTFTDGKKFDSSVDRGQPFSFQLGAGQVIKGWDQGIVGMKEGGKRKLLIPPELAYGARGAGNVIPANAELHFDVELLKVK